MIIHRADRQLGPRRRVDTHSKAKQRLPDQWRSDEKKMFKLVFRVLRADMNHVAKVVLSRADVKAPRCSRSRPAKQTKIPMSIPRKSYAAPQSSSVRRTLYGSELNQSKGKIENPKTVG